MRLIRTQFMKLTERIWLVWGCSEFRFKKPKRGELPEFDEKTGMVKVGGYEITSLGRLLLRSIDQDKKD